MQRLLDGALDVKDATACSSTLAANSAPPSRSFDATGQCNTFIEYFY